MSPDPLRYRRRSFWNEAGRNGQPAPSASRFQHPDQRPVRAPQVLGPRTGQQAADPAVPRNSVPEFVLSQDARRALVKFDHVLVERISDTYREAAQNYSRWVIDVLRRRLRNAEEERSRLEQDNEDLRKSLLAKGELQPHGIRAEFERLAEQWHDETGHMSSAISFTQHPAYLRIVAMGPAVVPFILEDLKRTRAHWFVALRLITGENPVEPKDKGNVQRLADAWIAWGRQRGLV